MINIVVLLLPLFGMIIFGYILGRTGIAERSWVVVLNLFGYYFAFPGLILKSLIASQLSFHVHGLIILVQVMLGVSLMVGTYTIGKWLKLSRDINNTFTIGVYFANAGYIGIPALHVVFGDAAAAEGTVIVSVMIALTLTLGIGLLEASRRRRVRWKQVCKSLALNPLMWSIVVGGVIGATQWPVPSVLTQLIQLMAASAAPTVLVSLGIFLALNRLRRETVHLAGLMVAIKMFIIPAALAIIMWFVPHNNWLETTFIQGSMPIAVTAFALAQLYPINKAIISAAIVLSTLASFIVIPLAMWLAPQL